jgi:hypothetical protein
VARDDLCGGNGTHSLLKDRTHTLDYPQLM